MSAVHNIMYYTLWYMLSCVMQDSYIAVLNFHLSKYGTCVNQSVSVWKYGAHCIVHLLWTSMMVHV